MMKLSSSITTGIACLLALCFAALSAAYWFTELADQPWQIIAIAVTGSVCVSLLGPAAAYNMRRFGWFLIVPAVVFVTADCYQNTQGYETFKGLTASAEIISAQARLDTAQAALDAIPNPSATGEIRNRQTWTETIETRTRLRDQARADLDALQAPSAPTLHVMAVMALIQIALSVLFACLGRPKDKSAARVVSDPKVVHITHRAKQMDPQDLKAWDAICRKA